MRSGGIVHPPSWYNIIYPLNLPDKIWDKIYKSSPSHTTPMENHAKLTNLREINLFSLRSHTSPLLGRGVNPKV